MPITKFQREVLTLLKANRNPNSYVAGGVAIHREASSARRSNDIDFFHETAIAVRESASADILVLEKNKYSIERVLDQPSFIRVVISKNAQSLKLEWVRDTAFRFFPVIEDNLLGFRLHDVDLAVNKCLALANRTEVRDIVDLIQMHETTLSFSATCWAACGKDPGFTPDMLIDCIHRHSIIRPEQLEAELLEQRVSAPDLKRRWLSILTPAAKLLATFPSADLGCIYLRKDGEVIRDLSQDVVGSIRHFGSLGGSWPQIVD